MYIEIERPLSPAGQAAWQRLLQQKRQNGSPSAPHFASRRRCSSPTPFEQGRKGRSYDGVIPLTTLLWMERDKRQREEEIQRRIRENRALAIVAKAEWLAFNGVATQDQYAAWVSKYRHLHIPGFYALPPVRVYISSMSPMPTYKPSVDFGGNVVPQRQLSRRNGNPYRKFQ